MPSKANTSEEYMSALPEEKKEVISKIRTLIQENISEDFKEPMSYNILKMRSSA